MDEPARARRGGRDRATDRSHAQDHGGLGLGWMDGERAPGAAGQTDRDDRLLGRVGEGLGHTAVVLPEREAVREIPQRVGRTRHVGAVADLDRVRAVSRELQPYAGGQCGPLAGVPRQPAQVGRVRAHRAPMVQPGHASQKGSGVEPGHAGLPRSGAGTARHCPVQHCPVRRGTMRQAWRVSTESVAGPLRSPPQLPAGTLRCACRIA